MDLHQPDTTHPSRLLATCQGCRCWASVEDCHGASTVVPVIPLLATFQGAD